MKLMVCPNCHSHEIIVVQGRSFCIGCGRLIEGLPEPATVPKPARRGRPKAGPLDVAVTPGPAAVAPQAPAAAIIVPSRRRLSDITPISPASAPTPAQTPAQAKPAPAATAPVADTHHHPPVPLRAVLAGAWGVLARPRLWALHILPVIMLVASAAWLALTAPGFSWRWPLPVAAWWWLGGALTALVLTHLVTLISHGAATFGYARILDHRRVGSKAWWNMSVRSLAARWCLDVLVLAFQLVIGVAITTLVVTGGRDIGIPLYGQIVLLLVAFLTLLYLGVGVIVAREFAQASSVLAPLPVRSAWQTGWHAYRRHFELFALKLFFALLFIVGLAVLEYAWWQSRGQLVRIVATIVATIYWVALSNYEQAVWLVALRIWVRQDSLNDASRLLAGRRVARLPKRFAVGAAVLIMALGLVAILLPLEPRLAAIWF